MGGMTQSLFCRRRRPWPGSGKVSTSGATSCRMERGADVLSGGPSFAQASPYPTPTAMLQPPAALGQSYLEKEEEEDGEDSE